WLVGSLLTLGDALADESYLDHAPILEMVYHLRNGVAHGNRFDIRNRKRLHDHPAHTRDAFSKGDLKQDFEITPALEGRPVLFDFMEAADILALVTSVANYLLRMADVLPGNA